jgi:hypothetical protein
MRSRGGHGCGRRGRRGLYRCGPPARMLAKPVFNLHLCEGGFDSATPVPENSAFAQVSKNGCIDISVVLFSYFRLPSLVLNYFSPHSIIFSVNYFFPEYL